jgi:hypothetical protein
MFIVQALLVMIIIYDRKVFKAQAIG